MHLTLVALSAVILSNAVTAYPSRQELAHKLLRRQTPTSCVSNCSGAGDSATLQALTNCNNDPVDDGVCICQTMAKLSKSCLDCTLGLAGETESDWDQTCVELYSLESSDAAASSQYVSYTSSVAASVTPLSSAAAAASSSLQAPVPSLSWVAAAATSAAASTTAAAASPSTTAKSGAEALRVPKWSVEGGIAGGLVVLVAALFA